KEFDRKVAAMIGAFQQGLKVEEAVSARNDRRHLSGVHARLVISDRGKRFAGIGVSQTELQTNVDAALATGLLWFEELQRRSGKLDGLMIFAPRCDTIAIRWTALAPTAKVWLYRIEETKGAIEPVSPFDQGDLNDRFRRAARRAHWPRPGMLPPDSAMLVESVRRLAPDHIETHHRGSWVSLSIRALAIPPASPTRRRPRLPN